MNTTLYVIRHGDVDNPSNMMYGRERNIALTQKGVTQLRNVGIGLKNKGVNPEIIYTSPLLRAIQSSNAIAESFPGIEIIQDEGLLEVNQKGCSTKSIDWFENVVKGDLYNYKGDDALVCESPEDQAKRMVDVVKKAAKAYKGKTAILVSHGDPITFMWGRLRQPEGKLPSRLDLLAQGLYPEKSDAVRLVFDENDTLIEQELIRGELR
jgi:broad specificity phosphatase PhoE